jgi:RsmE family RNA methyltransferase
LNLILLEPDDFIDTSRVRVAGRRFAHIATVLRAGVGDELTVGVAGGQIGLGVVSGLGGDHAELVVRLDRDPPPALPLTLVLALPRPKVLNRVIAGAVSMGIKRIYVINAWRVEKSYWSTPRLAADNLRLQQLLGLEQARDTIYPVVGLRRLFRPFVEDELPSIAAGTRALVAHPQAGEPCPRDLAEPVTLAIGPEGGFIEREIDSFRRIGFTPVTMGERILRVETALPALVAVLSRGRE